MPSALKDTVEGLLDQIEPDKSKFWLLNIKGFRDQILSIFDNVLENSLLYDSEKDQFSIAKEFDNFAPRRFYGAVYLLRLKGCHFTFKKQ